MYLKNLTSIIHVRLASQIYSKISAHASLLGISVSDLVRNILEQYYSKGFIYENKEKHIND